MRSSNSQAKIEVAVHARTTANGASKSRVLLASGDDEHRGCITSQLTHDGFEVREAQNGLEVLRWFVVGRRIRLVDPDVLVLAAELKGMSGFDLLVGLRRAGRQIPVVLLANSGLADLHERSRPWRNVRVLDASVDSRVLREALLDATRRDSERRLRISR
jgi:DNA-binding response OmpR family regulator